MTPTRDNRGRFINADEAAATRVLEAGVREAVRLLRPLSRPVAGSQRNGMDQ